MLKELARAIVNRYPADWRERYADEVLDLIASAPVRPYDVGELFRNMLVEQVRATVDMERPAEAAAKVMRWKAATVGGCVAVIQLAGWLLWWSRGLTEAEGERVMFLALSLYAVLGSFWCAHAFRQKGRASEDRSPFPPTVALVCLPMHLVASACWVWVLLSGTPTYSYRWVDVLRAVYHGLYLGGPLAAWLMMQIWPGQRLVRLLTDFQMAEGAVEGAERYIASCEEWIDKGVESPLADARKALEQRIHEREAVRERLNAFGHGSRLSPGS